MFSHGNGIGPLRERLWPAFEIHDQDIIAEKSAAGAFFPTSARSPGCSRSGTSTPS
ncbi:hypothetical protein [Mycobacterium sp. 050134]|uniref:hypothetical protein n=1 Tax=Mycobacterium sp. 050134 TaxID=3096111 RepID=UPI002EDADE18